MRNFNAISTLQTAGLRATKPRVALLTLLNDSYQPMSIQDIARKLRGKLDQVTTYRIIENFTVAGLVRQVDLRKGHPLFEIADSQDHHHIVCTDCGKIEDFVGCMGDEIAKRALRSSSGFSTITSHSLELFGTCKSCRS